MKREMPLQISDHVRTLGRRRRRHWGNSLHALTPLRRRIPRRSWPPSRDIGWRSPILPGPPAMDTDDLGRDQLDAIFADLLGRKMLWSNRLCQRYTCHLLRAFGALKPEILVSAVGAPYDTL